MAGLLMQQGTQETCWILLKRLGFGKTGGKEEKVCITGYVGENSFYGALEGMTSWEVNPSLWEEVTSSWRPELGPGREQRATGATVGLEKESGWIGWELRSFLALAEKLG